MKHSIVIGSVVALSLLSGACTKQQGDMALEYMKFGDKVACITLQMALTDKAADIAKACAIADEGFAFVDHVMANVKASNAAAIKAAMSKSSGGLCADAGAK